MAHKMPTTHVGCYRPAVLDGGSNPPISTEKKTAPGECPEPFSCFVPRAVSTLYLDASFVRRHFRLKDLKIAGDRAMHWTLSRYLDQARPLGFI